MTQFCHTLIALSLGLAHTALGRSRAGFHHLGTSQLHLSHTPQIFRQRLSGTHPRTSQCSMDASDVPFDADLKALQDRIKNSMQPSAIAQSMPKNIGEGYVLIFNAGTKQEGVYTLQYEEDTCILVFEASEEAQRFAGLLEAEDFDLPSVIKWQTKMIHEFCSFSQIKLGLVRQGSHLMPPEDNEYVSDTDPKTSRHSKDVADMPLADLKVLQDRIKNSMQPSTAVQSMPKNIGEGYVLIFNPGTEQEGVYTLQYEEDTCMLVFETSEQAHRFAGLLEAEDFDLPTAIKWPTKQIHEFCSFSQIKLGLVRQGSHLMPPEHNVYEEELKSEKKQWPGIQDHSSVDEMRQRLDRLFNEPDAGI